MVGGAGIEHAVILGGGPGSRLWPWTGPSCPKPLLPLGGGGRTLLSATLDRLEGVVPPDRIHVQASPQIGQLLVDAEERLGPGSLRPEPSPRDTAPAIALAMRRVLLERPDAVVAVLPADQRIDDEPSFRRAVASAAAAARSGQLVVLGVTPSSPSTAFGYLECAPVNGAAAWRTVVRFVEKPDAERAREFVAAGRFLWNAGIFVWRADRFWQALERHAPAVAEPVRAFVDSADLGDWVRAAPTSIDYALMEQADDVVAVPLDAGWDDIGSWEAICRLAERGEAGPAVTAELIGDPPASTIVLCIGTAAPMRAAVLAERPQLVVVGPQGLLVVPRDQADAIKRLLG